MFKLTPLGNSCRATGVNERKEALWLGAVNRLGILQVLNVLGKQHFTLIFIHDGI